MWRATLLVSIFCGCAVTGEPPDEDEDLGIAEATAVLVPTADVGSFQVEAVGDPTGLYRNVDDGTSAAAADDAATYVRTRSGLALGTHRVSFAGLPAGGLDALTATVRAHRGTGQGTVQIELYDHGALLRAAPARTLGATWTSYSETFDDLAMADPSELHVRVVLRNTAGSGYVSYTQLFVSFEAAPSARSPRGAWAIRQVGSLADLNAAVGQINTALDTPGVVGFGLRVPVALLVPSQGVFDPTVLDRGLEIARARGKLFKPRIIWGRYTPAWAAGPTFQDSGDPVPLPFTSSGGANTAFESAYQFVLEREAAWAATRPEVRMLDCGWYSLNYSELYFGPAVQTAHGASTATNQARFIAAHRRLIDIAIAAAAPRGVPVGFGLSGHGPIGDIAPALAEHMESLGPDSPLLYMQANGWGPGGEWGGALESTLDARVWPIDVRRAVQDISPKSCRTAGNWQAMFAQANSLATTYVEIYTYQWAAGAMNCDQAALAEMKRQIDLYDP